MNARCSLVSERSPRSGHLQCIHQSAFLTSNNPNNHFNKTMAWISSNVQGWHSMGRPLIFDILYSSAGSWWFSYSPHICPSANALCINFLTLCPFGIHFRGDTQWLCKDSVIFCHPGKLSNYWLRTIVSISDFILQNFGWKLFDLFFGTQ